MELQKINGLLCNIMICGDALIVQWQMVYGFKVHLMVQYSIPNTYNFFLTNVWAPDPNLFNFTCPSNFMSEEILPYILCWN